MTPLDIYAHFGLDKESLETSKARIMARKHAVRQALHHRGFRDEEIADVEGTIVGRYVNRTTVWYSLNRAKPDNYMRKFLAEAKKLAKNVRLP